MISQNFPLHRTSPGMCGLGDEKLTTLQNQIQGFLSLLSHIPTETYISTFVPFRLGAIHVVILTEYYAPFKLKKKKIQSCFSWDSRKDRKELSVWLNCPKSLLEQDGL